MSGVGESIETGSELVVSRGLGKRGRESDCLLGKGSFRDEDSVFDLDRSDDCTTLQMY